MLHQPAETQEILHPQSPYYVITNPGFIKFPCLIDRILSLFFVITFIVRDQRGLDIFIKHGFSILMGLNGILWYLMEFNGI